MYVLKESFPSKLSLPRGFIFDIETTGLSPKYHEVAMITYAYQEEQQWMLEQHMIEDPRDELLLLLHFFKMSKDYLYCVHYNGDSFDLPFLNKRLVHHHMDFHYPPQRGFDLYRHLKREKSTGGLSLKAQEKKVGYRRKDLLSGRDWVDLFQRYQEEKKSLQKEKLLLHNKEDVLATQFIVERTPSFQHEIHHRLYDDVLLTHAHPGKDEIRLSFYDGESFYLDLPAISQGTLLFSQSLRESDLSPEAKKATLLAFGNQVHYQNIQQELRKRGIHPKP